MILGVLGQDGSYLTEYLISLGYRVIGITRRHSSNADSYGHLKHLRNHNQFELLHGDVVDPVFMNTVICKYYPDELYHLAAQSHVRQSFDTPIDTFNTDAISTLYILEAIRKFSPDTKLYFAASSELFGGINCPETGYTELSPFHPRSPYAVAKLASYWTISNYREAYNLFCCSGILFNHESKRRGRDFVTKKVTNYVACRKLGETKKLVMGNIDASRDWGHSIDYIKAQHMMLQNDKPVDYVVAMGETHTIRDLLALSFNIAGLGDWEDKVEFDPKLMRPSEVPYLLGNPTKIKVELGWVPTYTFESMIEEMVKHDIDELTRL